MNNPNQTIGRSVFEPKEPTRASDDQIGGTHYKFMAIQPMEFAMANKLDYATANVIKYVVRCKGGREQRVSDLQKAIHCIQLLAQHEGLTL